MRLSKIMQKKDRLIIGLMSGTSHDGIDAALVKIQDAATRPLVTLINHHAFKYSPKLREKIGEAFNANADAICKLNFELGEQFANAALQVMRQAKLTPERVDAIASHGQTIFHCPPKKKQPGSTLQIGEAAVIAERTGVITISDFRPRDMAVGGHGAPLVPFADYLLFHSPKKVKAIQNIGGIANVTVVTDNLENVTAFDTGPGNALIDETIKIVTNGKKSFDVDGKVAARGKVDPKLLDQLCKHSYLAKKPPKSTGRELFGKEMAQQLLLEYDGSISNLITTLTKFTAVSIFTAYKKFVFPRHSISEMILCGGGCYNPVLVNFLQEQFKNKTKIKMIDTYGIPACAKEAISFALLGNATLNALPSNVPTATGAYKPVILGKITL